MCVFLFTEESIDQIFNILGNIKMNRNGLLALCNVCKLVNENIHIGTWHPLSLACKYILYLSG